MNIVPKFLFGAASQVSRSSIIFSRSICVNSSLRYSIFNTPNHVTPRIICNTNISIRSYAKSKDKGKEKGKKSSSTIISVNEISALVDYVKLTAQLTSIIERLQEDFVKNLSLRSAVGTIESLNVPFEGKNYELQELAQIVRKNPKTVILNVTTFPQAIPDILKAIQESGLNLNPQQDGTTVFLPVPKVTKEHRENLIKNAGILYRKHADNMKRINLQYMKEIKDKKGVSEDTIRSVQHQVTALIEKSHLELKAHMTRKTKELAG